LPEAIETTIAGLAGDKDLPAAENHLVVENELEPDDVIMDNAEHPQETATDAEARFSLHPDNPKNFLKLSAALLILTKKTMVADNLLREYCTELISVSPSSQLSS
jgi:hypothetical protein